MIDRLLIAAAIVLLAGVVGLGTIRADDAEVWPVKGKLQGKGDKKAKDVSGIACMTDTGFPRKCLVIDDELQGAQIVMLDDGKLRAGDFIPLIDDVASNGDPLEFDGEGVAYADGYFYVIGSHGHPRDKKRKLRPDRDAELIRDSIKAVSRVIRIQLKPSQIDEAGHLSVTPDIRKSSQIRTLLKDQRLLQPFIDRRLDENGLTVEGIAIRDKRVFVGLRGPVLTEKDVNPAIVSADRDKQVAGVFSVALASLFDDGAADPELVWLRLGKGRGIRDIVPDAGGFLILAGPSDDTDGDYAIYRWDDGKRGRPSDLPEFTDDDGEQIKPEALLPLDRRRRTQRILVLSDGGKEGAPRTHEMKLP